MAVSFSDLQLASAASDSELAVISAPNAARRSPRNQQCGPIALF